MQNAVIVEYVRLSSLLPLQTGIGLELRNFDIMELVLCRRLIFLQMHQYKEAQNLAIVGSALSQFRVVSEVQQANKMQLLLVVALASCFVVVASS